MEEKTVENTMQTNSRKRSLMSVNSMGKLLKVGGNKRVSPEAKHELASALEEIALRIAEQAAQIRTYAKRNTLRAEDVRFAVAQMK